MNTAILRCSGSYFKNGIVRLALMKRSQLTNYQHFMRGYFAQVKFYG
jgi:hypothetical protein